jgi:hypothetical protein
MKWLTWFLVFLLAAAPLYAKPKVEVRIKVSGRTSAQDVGDRLSKGGEAAPGNVLPVTVWFLNVTVTADNSEAVAKNNGQWCITGDAALDVNDEYRGILDGNSLEIQVPQKNNKIKKQHYEILDQKWRKLSDIS